MASVTDLTRWRDALLAARLNGVRRVRDSNGEEIEYRGDAEMQRAIAAADALIAAASGPPITVIQFSTSKGL